MTEALKQEQNTRAATIKALRTLSLAFLVDNKEEKERMKDSEEVHK